MSSTTSDKLITSPKQVPVLIVSLLTAFMAPFMSSALNLCITQISTDFFCGATTVTWVVNAYTLCTAAFSLPFGHLADSFGRRRMLIIGSTVFGASSLASAFAPNVYFLIAMRVVMSIGADIFLVANVPLALTYFSPKMRGRVIGVTITATFLGISLGPVLGGLINSLASWRWIFAICVAISAVVVVICLARVENDNHHDAVSLDMAGNILSVLALLALILGLEECLNYLWARVLIVVGIALLVAFVWHEKDEDHPVIQVRLFVENPAYGLSNLATLLSFGASFSVSYIMSIYLVNITGLDSMTAGLIMVCQPLMQALLATYAGKLSDRIPSYKVASFGMLVIVAGIVVLSFLGLDSSLVHVIIGLMIVGVGIAFFGSSNNNAILSCVDRSHYSEANSTISTMRGIGQSVSMVMVGIVFSLTIGNTVIAQADHVLLVQAVQAVFFVDIVVGIIAAVISMVRSKTPQSDKL